MALGPAGEVLISDTGRVAQGANAGTVYALTGPNQKKALLTGLDRPYGLALWKDYLYVAGTESVKRYKFHPTPLSETEGPAIIS